MENIWLFLNGGSAWMQKSLFLEEWTCWQSWPQIQRGTRGQIPWVCNLIFLIFPGLFLLSLVLRFIGSHILVLGERIVKARPDLLRFAKP